MDVFDALADPLRRELLTQLSCGPARVVDLADAHPVSRPAISRHLRVLSEAGLVEADELGRERHYRLRTEPLAEVRSFVTGLMRQPRLPEHTLDALATEVRRTTRDRRRAAAAEDTA
ncbi:ArsR family transcriptional regulator [Aeromicrobium camelliae]|uniref:ArsR family transcriptional regulator n=1 Tax=Aeromicrobium camelliae TaxID=1538144 RepID=A0A3N6X5R3_9ACTN|nr:metalloregulator ArsR/SmtB family transcription factor [Aeromicrobium camelliae]RQN09008.1 ArsR family transcriptional regulator [Aeromicrobium camelliae]